MRIRRNVITRQETIADTAAMVYRILSNKPITAIDVIFDATTNTPGGTSGPLLEDIEDLRVVDGSKIIVNGDGNVLQAMQYGYGQGMGPVLNSENTTAERAESAVRLSFGRYYGDPEYYLNPAVLQNPQLMFQAALDIGAGNFTTGTLRCTIIIHTIEAGAGAHKGTLHLQEIVAHTLAANAEGRIDLPPEGDYFGIGFLSESAAGVALHPVATLLNIKVSENNDAFILCDERTRHMWLENIKDMGVYFSPEEELDDWLVNQANGVVMPNITLESHYVAPAGLVYLKLYDHFRNSLFTPDKTGNLRAILTGGGVGGVVRIMLHSLM